MAFEEDLSLYFGDFGKDATAVGKTGKVLLNVETITTGEGRAASVEYIMVYETTLFPDLAYQDAVFIEDVEYRVNHSELQSDGKLSRAYLGKIED